MADMQGWRIAGAARLLRMPAATIRTEPSMFGLGRHPLFRRPARRAAADGAGDTRS